MTDADLGKSVFNAEPGAPPAPSVAALEAEIRRLRDCILSARWRLAKGRALWNGPCHECDAALERALTGREAPSDARRAATPPGSPTNPAVAWQSIETAPTDGTPVLLWDGIDVAFGRFSWPDSIEEWWSLEGEEGAPGPEAIAEYQLYVDSIDVGWISETLTTIEYLHPTHWMPLPSPPQTGPVELREQPNTDAAQEPTPGST